MIRTLLTSTALVAVLTTGAFAADNADKAAAGTEMNGSAIFMKDGDVKPLQSDNGYFSNADGQVLASTLIGQRIYAGTSEDAEDIGEVNDVVLGPDGSAEAVVIGVGGFLGIGEKDVAVDFERLTWVERNDDRWLTINATQEELEAAPAFDRSVLMGEERTTAMSESAEQNADEMQKTVSDKTAAMSDEAKKMGEKATAYGKKVMADAKTMINGEPSGEEVEVDAQTISAEEVIGTTVYGAQKENLGEVGDVIVSSDGAVKAYIIDVGGFLGIGEKEVAMNSTDLHIKKDGDGDLRVYTDFTEKSLDGYPTYSKDAFMKDPNSVLSK